MSHSASSPMSFGKVRMKFRSFTLPFVRCLLGLLFFFAATPVVQAQCVNLAGTWRINDAGIFPGTMTLAQSVCSISGQITFDDGEPVQSLSGSTTASAINFVLFNSASNCVVPGVRADSTFSGTISANGLTMSGIYVVPGCPDNTWAATRASPPSLTLSCPAGYATVNAHFASAFVASGGTGTYTSYAIVTGSLPLGLSLNSVGGVSGTPTTPGTLSFTGTVADSSGATATSPACSITVAPPQCTFSLSYSSRNFSKDGGPAGVDVTASDVSCPVSSSSPVDWVLITSIQPQYGSGTVYFSVSPNLGAKRQTSITLANQALLITQDGNLCSGSGDITPLGVVDFKQCGNPFQTQWWNKNYDSNGASICEDGCLLTAYADVLSFFGYAYNPSTLNTTLVQLGVQGYTSSGDVVPGAISIVTGGALHVQFVSTFGDVDTQLCNGRPVILDVGGHFVVATGKVGGLYTINDPATVQPSGPISSFASGRVLVP